MAEKTDLSLAVSETPKIGYVTSGPILSNGPQSAHQLARGGADSWPKLYADWDSYSIESKSLFLKCVCSWIAYFLTPFTSSCGTRKRVKIYWCVSVVPRPRCGPALDTNMYKGRTQNVGYMYYDLSFQKWAQKMKQNAITMNNNNESKNIQVKACILGPFWCCCCCVCVRTSHLQAKVILRRANALPDRLVPFWCKEYICVLYPALNGLWLVRRYKTK